MKLLVSVSTVSQFYIQVFAAHAVCGKIKTTKCLILNEHQNITIFIISWRDHSQNLTYLNTL